MINKINKLDLNKSGIYKITNTVNNNFYIGSAYNFYNRFRTHKSTLKNNKHDNSHLQKAFNKYGEHSFIFEMLLEIEDLTKLYDIEEEYLISKYDKGLTCYNMNTSTKSEILLNEINKLKRIEFSLVSPDGILHNFTGFTEAAKMVKIPDIKICNVAAGFRLVFNKKVKNYKGWRLPENVDYDYKSYSKIKGKGAKTHYVKLLGPDGKVYENIHNLESFAKEHNISSSIFSNIIAKRTRYSNGWSLFDGNFDKPQSKNSKTFDVILVDPNGIEYNRITNLTKFCKEHGVNISSIRQLIKGNIKKQNYKGWKIK